MVWQRAGTVAVQNGSTTVVGTSVDFAASSRNGDSFVGPDGATYEVANVASSTVISILPAYKGPTVTGAAYAIMPVQGYDKMLSDAFNSLNNQFGPKLAALGTTGNYEILPVNKGGTGRAGPALGTAAAGNIGTAVGDVMAVGTGGLYGSPSALPQMSNLNIMTGRSFELGQYAPINGVNTPGAQSQYGIAMGIQGSNSEWRHILQFTAESDVYDISITNPSQGGQWRVAKFYTTLNTTRAADGTLKAI